MITYPLYAYFDVIGTRSEIDSSRFTVIGAWSSATTYTPFQAVTLGNSIYLCLIANTNQSPSAAYTIIPYWSPLVVINTGPDQPALGTLSVETLSAVNFSGSNIHIQTGTFTMLNTVGTRFNVVLQTTNGTTQFQFFPS